ncbi:uncharacterized protein LOC121955449 [Plectropomus leopardus]|uniref:uncharacterized protein LOC121955449 n=1 Tax=Plectropomus leopardus TaxID=160734 RepID=UPI001C4A9850|nr:uncharacterized protein LOC121955449 [Plectropomus leopardus]
MKNRDNCRIKKMDANCYPICTKIGLDLDVTSKLGKKKKLSLKLLTRAAVFEIHTFATKKTCHNLSQTLYDILDYNFDLSSQHHRRWEFSTATAFEIKKLVKQYPKEHDREDEVFKLPFVLAQNSSSQPKKRRRLEREEETQTASDVQINCDMEQEGMERESTYTVPLEESDLDSNIVNEYDMEQEKSETKNSLSCSQGESDLDSDIGNDCGMEQEENSNMNTPPASQLEKRGLCGGEDQIQTLRNAPNKCDFEQEKMGIENNIWKLRANRVKEILSSPNKEFGAFYRSKKFGLEFDVGFGPKKNISVDTLPNCVLLEIAKFALAINSSQQDFITEILEYNIDFGPQSQHQKNLFACEIMNRVKELQNCEDSVKFSKEVFHLPMSSVNMTNQSLGNVHSEPGSASKMEKCVVALVFPPDSHAETKEHMSKTTVNLYPFCKEIGLKLHVNQHHQSKRLDINKLTNGAMTEVADFAEKLCGTFEQICLDILRHNFDLDLQSGDSDLARNILAKIPAIMEQTNLSNCFSIEKKIKGTRKKPLKYVKLDCENSPNLDRSSAGSSEASSVGSSKASSAGPCGATVTKQNDNSYTGIDQEDKHNIKLWKLRANHIKHILSIPHEEHCPLYSYSRCKKLGIDFNVGSGVKLNLDLKLLTNGIMVELNTFATALLSAQRYFITEILEHNFHLDFNSELQRSAFALLTRDKIRGKNSYKKNSPSRMKMPFELPDLSSIPEPSSYCPKCHQDRKHMLLQDKSDTGEMHYTRPHIMTNTVSADLKCTTQKSAKDPSSNFSTTEDIIMDSFPLCKKIGLNLCVDKEQPEDKLSTHVLTLGIMVEVARFAKRVCGTKNKIINDVLEHNFNMQGQEVKFAELFVRELSQNDGSPAWFSKVYTAQESTHRQPGHVGKLKLDAVMQRSEWRESIKKRRLGLQTKKEQAKLPSHNISEEKSNTNHQSKENSLPFCTDICLDKDITSQRSDILRQSKSSCLGSGEPFVSLTYIRSSLPADKSKMNSSASQPDQKGLCGGEEQIQTARNEPNECDIEQEEIGTENNIWKLRANRVKQILSELGPFYWSNKVGLEFDVGFGPMQNISNGSLPNSAVLEVAKFALAMNASQQNFIMEILEYNFDLYFQSKYQRNIFTCEMMDTVRQLKDCQDTVRFSKEIFDLPYLSTAQDQGVENVGSIEPELSNVSRMEECNVDPIGHPHSHSQTKKHMLPITVDPYPFCREIGLILHVNQRHQNKKLDINTLTNGAMNEVANFAEQLCGTFEQICLDILRHNLTQSGDSDFAINILAQIPAMAEQKTLSKCAQAFRKIKRRRKDYIKNEKPDEQNDQDLDACSVGSSLASLIDQHKDSYPDTTYQKELNLLLWKLRANHIQEIFSIPHGEHCPLYSYSRCKKLGIDFNVGYGVKQNLDLKLLTNGIMAEICTFATALLSAQKYFITEILEYNFYLNFHNELYRSAFAQQTWDKIRARVAYKDSTLRRKIPFELPDMRFVQEPTYEKTTHCPKCYQEREYKIGEEETDPKDILHHLPHTMTAKVSADADSPAQELEKDQSSDLPLTIEEMIMDSYPLCKKLGLNLCVKKDQPKDKLDMYGLTVGIMVEVANFAKELCSTKPKVIQEVLEHNFSLGTQDWRHMDIIQLFRRAMAQKDAGPTWFNEVFVLQTFSHRTQPEHVSTLDEASALRISERKDTIKKRKLALQSKEERAPLPSYTSTVEKSKTKNQSRVPVNCFPICTEIGLELDVTSKSAKKRKLNLNLLTGAVVLEIHKFASKKTGYYLPHTVFDILDFNFDLSSQHYRRWQFSIATTSKVQTMVKNYRKYGYGADEVFKLPFVLAPNKRQSKRLKKYSRRKANKRTNKGRGRNQKHKLDQVCSSQEEPNMKMNENRFVRQVRYCSDSNQLHFLYGFKNNKEGLSHDKNTEFLADEMIEPMKRNLVDVACGSPRRENIQIKKEEHDPQYDNLEMDAEEKYHLQCDDVETESTTEDVDPLQANMQNTKENNSQHGHVKLESYSEENYHLQCDDVKTESTTEDFDPLQGNIQIKEEEYDPQYGNMKSDTEENYHPQCDDVKTESTTEDVEHEVSGQPTEPLEYTSLILCPDSERQQTESENRCVQYYVLAEPQGSAVYANTSSNIKTGVNAEGVKYLIPVQAVGYPMITTGQSNESTLIEQKQENVPAGSHHDGVKK